MIDKKSVFINLVAEYYGAPLEQEERAYAKINLHLEILNKRNDGFHNIFSLMAQVGLFDILKLKSIDIDSSGLSEISVDVIITGGDFGGFAAGIDIEENLITKAVRNFCKEAGISGSFVFLLEKNIPAGAGLGGGSSNAAAVLRMLNRRFALPPESLLRAASMTGADVPFLLEGGYAICEGTGDIIESLKGGLGYAIVLVNNGIHINTGEAYLLLDRGTDFSKPDVGSMKDVIREFIRAGDLSKAGNLLVNDFEPVVFERHPVLRGIKRKMLDAGADFAFMSGSGSTIAGLFADREKALSACESLKNEADYVALTGFSGNTIEASPSGKAPGFGPGIPGSNPGASDDFFRG